MIENVFDFTLKLSLTVGIGLVSFFSIGLKKFVEKTSELMAEDWYKKRKGQ